MKGCRLDALKGLKKIKDEGRIVSVEDDVLKRLLELPGKRMFKCLTTCSTLLPFLTCETAEIRFLGSASWGIRI